MVLIIDNYDSFTYNLYQYIGCVIPDIIVKRNDRITAEQIKKLSPSHIVISPGPKYPKQAGISIECIKQFSNEIPILGVCLGHQAIVEAFGGRIVQAENIMHGKTSVVNLNTDNKLFSSLPDRLRVARYHSLIAEKQSLPKCLEIISTDEKGVVMAVKHREYNVFGVQFHPESILTDMGNKIIENFLSI
ncbi:MAG: aminodeoxychorismate/anthranilate synthase component II [Clostridiales bacterium]|nr:aminodeoxychorismate/anthranilate synthase component II [Clostridiales bacterium]